MIRHGKIEDLEEIMRITKEDFLIDINENALYVYEENNKLIGFICIKKDIDNDYEKVKESTKEDAYIMHRLGIDKEYRHLGIAYKLMEYGEKLAKQNDIYLMKADTEISNIKMNSLFKKLGYQKLSEFNWSDNDGQFNYYEKRLEK